MLPFIENETVQDFKGPTWLASEITGRMCSVYLGLCTNLAEKVEIRQTKPASSTSYDELLPLHELKLSKRARQAPKHVQYYKVDLQATASLVQ